jgi:hypothetical protein
MLGVIRYDMKAVVMNRAFMKVYDKEPDTAHRREVASKRVLPIGTSEEFLER